MDYTKAFAPLYNLVEEYGEILRKHHIEHEESYFPITADVLWEIKRENEKRLTENGLEEYIKRDFPFRDEGWDFEAMRKAERKESDRAFKVIVLARCLYEKPVSPSIDILRFDDFQTWCKFRDGNRTTRIKMLCKMCDKEPMLDRIKEVVWIPLDKGVLNDIEQIKDELED